MLTHTHSESFYFTIFVHHFGHYILAFTLCTHTVAVYERVFNAFVHSENERRIEKEKNEEKGILLCFSMAVLFICENRSRHSITVISVWRIRSIRVSSINTHQTHPYPSHFVYDDDCVAARHEMNSEWICVIVNENVAIKSVLQTVGYSRRLRTCSIIRKPFWSRLR